MPASFIVKTPVQDNAVYLSALHMFERILNNGVVPGNGESLRRKIRISNLVALISVLVMTSYTPVYIFYAQIPGIVMNSCFWGISLFTFLLLHQRRYDWAFFVHCSAGYVYFITGTLFYGTATNLHFYMIVMCMIVTTLFDNRNVIRFYLAFAVLSFFALIWWSNGHTPLAAVSAEMQIVETITGYVNMFLLFIISSLFLLFFKRDMLRSQERVTEQKAIIEEKNRDITDSIQYAKRIQTALLPGKANLEKLFPRSFLYFRPKDLVSGDFYWLSENDDYRFIAVGDCTGHGVPGALMSVLGINLLREIVENRRITDPAEILEEVRSGIIYAFGKEGKSGKYKDGMDLALVRISKREARFSYAAANNPVYHVSDGVLSELPADKQPVGYSHEMKSFATRHGTYTSSDFLLLFTDGYADQFGGPKNKKFLYRPFRELLLKSLAVNPEQLLDDTFEAWRGSNEQVDDVCVAGIAL